MTQLSECLFEKAEPRWAVIETQPVKYAPPAEKTLPFQRAGHTALTSPTPC